jgi:branched-chain amino acid transport system permease protein
VVGGLIFGLLPELLRDVARPEVQWIVYGLAMIAIVFFLPHGIVPALSSVTTRRERPTTPDVREASP